MQIIKPHHNLSKRVKKYEEIREVAERMKKFVNSEFTTGYFKEAYGLCHCEVSQDPYAFFVVNKKLIEKKVFKHVILINPEIIGVPEKVKVKARGKQKAGEFKNEMLISEACMMFPFRKPKKITRAYEIKVKYQIPVLEGRLMPAVKMSLSGLAAQLFQHCIDHMEGHNLYFGN